jgi:hypothetical protein
MSKLFTVAGVTQHTATGVVVDKVRFGTDLVRVTKMLNNPKKIWHTETKQCLNPARVDFVTLPSPMNKIEAAKYLLTCDEFQSAADQALIQETIGAKTPKTPRTPKAPKVKATKAKPSIDSIKSRAKKSVTAEQVVAAALAAEATAE